MYAGTRQPLSHPDDRVTPLSLDVTSAEQIQAAASQVKSLDMLINNSSSGPTWAHFSSPWRVSKR